MKTRQRARDAKLRTAQGLRLAFFFKEPSGQIYGFLSGRRCSAYRSTIPIDAEDRGERNEFTQNCIVVCDGIRIR